MSLSLLAYTVRMALSDATRRPATKAEPLAYEGVFFERIVLGPPHEVAKLQQEDNNAKGLDYLSVFFYQMGYSGFPADATPLDPLYMRAFCLITAFGGRPSSGTPTPGESELRLTGSILEYFHRHPTLKLEDDSGKTISQLQIVPTQLSLDNINHLWSSQSTPYRLSVAYEFALLPVPLKARAERDGPPVKTIIVDTVTKES